jgi:hypothetical protein
MKITYAVTDRGDTFRLFTDVLNINARLAGSVLHQVDGWLKNNGPEWTILILKDIKNLFLQHYAGNKTFRVDTLSFHSDGTPVGPFRGFWTIGSSYRMLDKVCSALMIYSGITIVGHPTRAQLAKFYKAVEHPRPNATLPPWKMSNWVVKYYRALWLKASYDTFDQWSSRQNKFTITFDPKKGIRKVPETDLSMYDHLNDLAIWFHGGIRADTSIVPILQQVLKFPVGTGSYRRAQKSASEYAAKFLPPNNAGFNKDVPLIVGCIGHIQERGGKLRSVANPLRGVQVVLSRLANWLGMVAERGLPWDCTFDQEKGVRWAKRKLAQGIRLHAFDLSNASDTIPLEDQISFLKYVGPVGDAEFNRTLSLYEKISRGAWYDPYHPERFLCWTKGQALGVKCSFGTFSQTHGARLHQLSRSLGLHDAFVVLGDDVIVVDDLAKPYYHFVTDIWGCDINPAKTLSSDSITEFASKLTTASREIKTFKFPKGSKHLFCYERPLELLIKYGKNALKLVPSQRRAEIQVLSGLPRPRGLGWKWPDNELLSIDGLSLTPYYPQETLDNLPDLAFVTVVERPYVSAIGRIVKDRYVTSYEVTERPHREREQDLRVAFVYMPGNYPSYKLTASDLIAYDHSLTLRDGKVQHHRKRQEDTNLQQISSAELEFQVLHVNENLDDPSDHVKELHEHLTVVVKTNPLHRGYSFFELRERALNTQLSIVRENIKKAVYAMKQWFLWLGFDKPKQPVDDTSSETTGDKENKT